MWLGLQTLRGPLIEIPLYIGYSLAVNVSTPLCSLSVDPDQLLAHGRPYVVGSGSRGEGGATSRRTGDAHPHSEWKTVGLPSGELARTRYMSGHFQLSNVYSEERASQLAVALMEMRSSILARKWAKNLTLTLQGFSLFLAGIEEPSTVHSSIWVY